MLIALCPAFGHARSIYFTGLADNDLYTLLKAGNFDIKLCPDASSAVSEASEGDGIIISASDYPYTPVEITEPLLTAAKAKGVRIYAEYVNNIPGSKSQIQFLQALSSDGLSRPDFSSQSLALCRFSASTTATSIGLQSKNHFSVLPASQASTMRHSV